MSLGRFEAEWFSHLDWARRRVEIIAESEDQVRAYVDEICPGDCRTKPYQPHTADPVDTLKIIRVDDVVFPYVLTSNEF